MSTLKKMVFQSIIQRIMIEHYGIDFDALEERRQKECVKRWEEAIKDIVDIEAFYAAAK